MGRREGTLICCWWERKRVPPLWKSVWVFLKKLHIDLLYNPPYYSWAYIENNVNQYLSQISAYPCLL
jgi:hypothetical protein